MKRWTIPFVAVALIGLLGVAHVFGWTAPLIRQTKALVGRDPEKKGESPKAEPSTAPQLTAPRATPEGLVIIGLEQQRAIGLQDVEVVAQTEPTQIELPGTTAYNPDTLTKVRPRFDALVRAVQVTHGQAVKQGDVLVELYSAQLAEAKTSYQASRTQYDHDKRLLDVRAPLAKTDAISQNLWADTQNGEIKSRLAFKVARDELLVYGLSDSEIDGLAKADDGGLALMTIRSPANGVVISRDAVPGNIYNPDDIMLVIAPMDQLRVWAYVYESDLPLVGIGRRWTIQFPYLNESVETKVEHVSDQVDPQTHSVHIRGTIGNPSGRFKADMLVKTLLDIPPVEGHTVIPRKAMVTADGGNFVFVRPPGTTDRFERRSIGIVQERRDRVLVGEGLRPGEVVVAAGSLLVNQIFDNLVEPKHEGS